MKIFCSLVRALLLLLAMVTVATIQASSASPAVQQVPAMRITFSEPLAIFVFSKSLTERGWYGSKPFTKLFRESKFATKPYLDAIAALESLRLGYYFEYPDYPGKNANSTGYLLHRDLVRSSSLEEFRSRALGTIPNEDLAKLLSILNELTPVYRELVYTPNKDRFEQQLSELRQLLTSTDAAKLLQQGLTFYDSVWDPRDEFILAFFPVPGSGGYTATTVANMGMSPLPTGMTDYGGLLSVMFHEVFHIFYDEQSRAVKRNLTSWFAQNPSRHSEYAQGLLNEALATALGNGYVASKLKGSLNEGAWYNDKHISLMAKLIYPTVLSYLESDRRIDQVFVDKYVELYDSHTADFLTVDGVLSGRDVLFDRASDVARIDTAFPHRVDGNDLPLDEKTLKSSLKKGITRLILVTGDHEAKLKLIRENVPELGDWQPDAKTDFAYAILLPDRRYLIVVNAVTKGVDELLKTVKL